MAKVPLADYPQPKYKFGQKVHVKVETEDKDTKVKFSNMLEMYIRTIFADSSERAIEFYYGLTTEMPQPSNSGHAACKRTRESEIIIVDDEPNLP